MTFCGIERHVHENRTYIQIRPCEAKCLIFCNTSFSHPQAQVPHCLELIAQRFPPPRSTRTALPMHCDNLSGATSPRLRWDAERSVGCQPRWTCESLLVPRADPSPTRETCRSSQVSRVARRTLEKDARVQKGARERPGARVWEFSEQMANLQNMCGPNMAQTKVEQANRQTLEQPKARAHCLCLLRAIPCAFSAAQSVYQECPVSRDLSTEHV